MPKLAANVTELARKYRRLLTVAVVFIFVLVFLALVNDVKTGLYTQPASLGSVPVQLDIAKTEAERVRGLSGRRSLGKNQGLLFVFERPGPSCMWMKDMLFSIDVLWLGEDYRVIDIAQDISPDTYPQSFCADEPAQYFLELPAGFVAEHRVQTGTQLQLH